MIMPSYSETQNPAAPVPTLPDIPRHLLSQASAYPATIVGVAQRLAVYFGGQVAYSDRWIYQDPDSTGTAQAVERQVGRMVLAVIRSLSELEQDEATSASLENVPGVVEHVMRVAILLMPRQK